MKQVFANRANKILYNFIKSNELRGTILLPSNICSGVVSILKSLHLDLHFIDIDSNTLCINETTVIENVKSAQLLLYVHTYGVEDNPSTFFQLVKHINPNIAIVDDRCLCMPKLENNVCGADLVLYSTGPKKQLNLGCGGIGFISDDWDYRDIIVDENNSAFDGLLTNNIWEFNESQYIIVRNDVLLHKSKLNAIYKTLLPQNIQLEDKYQRWRFNIFVNNKEKILNALFSEGLFASNHYKPYDFNAERSLFLYNHVINLFNDFYYTEEQAKKTCELIMSHLGV